MADKKTIDIIIGTLFKATGIDAAKRGLANFAKGVGKNLMNIKAGFDMAAAALRTFVSAMAKGMEFERLTAQFKTLTGSLETAKQHMADLRELGRTPPFDLESFAAASREMMKMSDGVVGFKKEMQIVGDLAAATGNDISSVARAFGMAYQVIRDGESFGRAGQQLFTLGILTKKQVAEFDALSKSGADNAQVWAALTEAFSKYSGAMAETEKTSKGLVDAIKGELEVAVTDFSMALNNEAKPAMEGLLGWMKRINEDGTIEMWADKCCRSFDEIVEGAKPVLDIIGGIGGFLVKMARQNFQLSIGSLVTGGKALMNGEGIGGAASAVSDFIKKTGNEIWDIDGSQAAADQSKQDKIRAQKAKRKAEESAQLEEEQQRKVQEDLARAQAETDKRLADERAKKEAELAKKAEAERLKAVEKEQKAREQMEAALSRQRIQSARAELAAANKQQSALQSASSAARTEFDKAFGMYRDKDLAASTIAEERAYAADYKRLGKDAAKYGGRWRIDELAGLMAAGDTQGQAAKLEEWRKSKSFTPEVEAMVRASAADQTRTTAEAELRKISANTEALSNKLDELLQVK